MDKLFKWIWNENNMWFENNKLRVYCTDYFVVGGVYDIRNL